MKIIGYEYKEPKPFVPHVIDVHWMDSEHLWCFAIYDADENMSDEYLPQYYHYKADAVQAARKKAEIDGLLLKINKKCQH